MNNLTQTIIDKSKSLGISTLSSLFPRDFEYYMIALELCDGDGIMLDYFTFPIMPNNIEIIDSPSFKVQSTFGGVGVLSSNIFTPKKITLSGNFGRNVKILNRGVASGLFAGFAKKNKSERGYGADTVANTTLEFNANIKTGYGCIKVLESILNRSYEIDSQTGKVNKLYFYNLAFGESYLVKYEQSKMSQSLPNNMIWEYSVNLQAICPLHLDKNKGVTKLTTNSGSISAFGMGIVQQSTNDLIKSLF